MFLVVSKVWLINHIMEPNGKFNDAHFLLAELVSLLGEGRSSPLLQQSEDMLVGVVKSPVLGIFPEDAVPPLLCLLFSHSQTSCEFLEIIFVLSIKLDR